MSPPTDAPALEQHAKQARELYRRLISPEMEAANLDRLVSFDTDSEDFEIGDDLIEVVHRLRARRPTARVFSFRVGGGGGPVDRFGFARPRLSR
jgi:hypothetical protein